MRAQRRTLLLSLVALGALVVVPVALADASSEDALAQKYAPVVRLVAQPEECGPGEPFIPTDVDVLFDEPTVAFRGPWNRTDLVKIAPVATDLRNRYEHHLDFPGDPLDAGCDYELWARRLTAGTKPTVYAHVATDPGYPGKLALQYWFFYPFNDFNNTHEGDWEMTQLVFDAAERGRGADEGPRPRSATARTREPSAPPGATRSSRSSTARIRSSTRLRARTRTSSLPRSISGAPPRPASAATTRSARIASCFRS